MKTYLEMSNAEKWQTLRLTCERRIALYEPHIDPNETGKGSIANLVAHNQRLLPLITELQNRSHLHWLTPLSHHGMVDLHLPPLPHAYIRRFLAFYSPAPDSYQLFQYVSGPQHPNGFRYELLFSGSLVETVDAAETLIPPGGEEHTAVVLS